MSTREDSDKTDTPGLTSALEQETTSTNASSGQSTSTSADSAAEENSLGSINGATNADSQQSLAEGDMPALGRRKSALMSAGSRLQRTTSAEKHVTIVDSTENDTSSKDVTASELGDTKDEVVVSAKDEEANKKELASILQQFDPLVETKNKDESSNSEATANASGQPIGHQKATDVESGAALSPDMSLTSSSSSSPKTPQLDSPQTSHDVKIAMSEKAAKAGRKKSEGRQKSALSPDMGSRSSSKGSVSSSANDPPIPKEIPFDFHKFLEQMRHRSAMPITRYFQSFLKEFDKKPWTVNEQIKIIHDFLDFITGKMEICDLWKNASDQEFENVKEGMEKLVMNRLFAYTFSPSTTDDAERDEVLNQKIRIFRWIREEHLDIPHSRHNEACLNNAQIELKKINSYKAPRDKVICILNCCKFIFTLIRRSEGNSKGADTFLPILIYVVLRSNPPNLVSNVQYISRFRNPDKLQAEAGYYLASLMGAISFIENLEASSLSISLEEFDQQIEKTMAELSQERSEEMAALEMSNTAGTGPVTTSEANPTSQEQTGQILLKKQESKLAKLMAGSSTRSSRHRNSPLTPSLNEKRGLSPGPQHRNSQQQQGSSSMSEKPSHHSSRGGSESSSNLNYSRAAPSPSSTILNPAAALIERGANFATKTMQKPLDLIERMFQDNGDEGEMSKPYPPRPSPSQAQPPALPRRPEAQSRQDSFQEFVYVPSGDTMQQPSPFQPTFQQQQYPGNLSEVPPNSEHARRQTASSAGGVPTQREQHERQQQTAEEYKQTLDALADMFPSCERQVCDVILQANDGRLSPSIDNLLEISSANEKMQSRGKTEHKDDDEEEEEAPLISFSPPSQPATTLIAPEQENKSNDQASPSQK
ncbi:hypothetical protein BGZ94_008595 [Podila epigama]|nr:hypothetical protein BGZ94_008595 [Podila epigama]